MSLEQTWRWFGSSDPVTLGDIRQSGATGIVTALHHIPNGSVWPEEEILKRKDLIEWDDCRQALSGLRWSVVESVPVTEDIKKRTGNFQQHIANYQQTIRNLAKCGIDTLCYNFMPVLDWTRTDLNWTFQDGSRALRYDHTAFAAFDLFLLQRPNAKQDYDEGTQERARLRFEQMSEQDKQTLIRTIITGLPGAEEGYSLKQLQQAINGYHTIDSDTLRNNLFQFLEAIVPVAEECGMQLAIHPDDPPRPVLGLPRIASNENDYQRILEAVDSTTNGMTFCTGSLGAQRGIDLPGMVHRLGSRIHFIHLRNTRIEDDGISFHEADHLNGDTDMPAVIRALLQEQCQRQRVGRKDVRMPMRPDHGHQMLDDLNKTTLPGYSCIGRMRGLAEIRGVMMAMEARLWEKEGVHHL